MDVHLSSSSFSNDPSNPLVAEIRDLFAGATPAFRIVTESDTGKLAIDAQTGEVATDFNDQLCSFADPEMEKEDRSKPKRKADRRKYMVVEIPVRTGKPAAAAAAPPRPEDPAEAEKKRLEEAAKREAQQEMMRKELQIYSYGESVTKVLSQILRA